MQKKYILALPLILMSSITTTTLPIGEQQRDFLYTVHTLGQDFTDLAVIRDNIDHFIGITQAQQLLLQVQLKAAQQATKKTAIKQAAVTAGAVLLRALSQSTYRYITTTYRQQNSPFSLVDNISSLITVSIPVTITACLHIWSVLDVCNIFKKQQKLQAALTTNSEILTKLIELQVSLYYEPAPEGIAQEIGNESDESIEMSVNELDSELLD